jgi:methylmalonic acid semialdehyde dehydrogenase
MQFGDIGNIINGAQVPPSTGEYMEVESPSTGLAIARVGLSSAADVDTAVQAAHQALQTTWSRQKHTMKSRCAILYRFRELVLQHKDELVELVVAEHGKTAAEAAASIMKGLETVEWACSMPQIAQGRVLEVSRGVTCEDVREPIGVVACIVPFNFPFMVPHWTLPIALAAGNCVILKPSEKVPLTMHRTLELYKQAGLPDGVLQIVNGTAPVVQAICAHPGIAGCTFVGSSKVAEIVYKACHASGKRVLALGGAKNHMVALPDCNKSMCAADVAASFTGCAGQRCMAATVLLVVGDQPDLIDLIVEKAKALQPGQGAGAVMGPVIDQMSKDRIMSYISDSEAGGAKVLLDGRSWAARSPGYWVGPTILLHTNPKDKAMNDEIFGPVLSIYKVANKEEAIQIENGNPYGNAACIYTTVGSNAEWFAERFSVGMVGVNIGVPVPREPFSFGGWNLSRFGDSDITGDGGMEFFTKRKKITTKWNPPQNQDWMS